MASGWIITQTWPPYIRFQLSPNHGAPSGLVLLSAYPILSSQLSIDQNRYGMLWAEIDVKGVSTLVVVIHTPRPKNVFLLFGPMLWYY